MIDPLSCLPVAAPLLAALLLAFVNPHARSVLRGVAALGVALALGATVLAWLRFDPAQAGYQHVSRLLPLASIRAELFLGFDPISVPLSLMTGLVGLAAVLAVDATLGRLKDHLILLLVGVGACNGAFLSADLFYYFFFCEVTTLPKYLLVARWARPGADRVAPGPAAVAMEMTLYKVLAAMVLLGVIVVLAAKLEVPLTYGQLGAAARRLSAGEQTVLYGLTLFALGTWSGLWPLHAWAPPAYGASQAPANMLFAGVAKTLGSYGLLRFGAMVLPAGAAALHEVLLVLGIVNVLYAAWASMAQRDWNRLIAYASISHAGYTFIALGVGTEPARNAAVVLMVAHGLVTATGFLLSDELLRASGGSAIGLPGGLGRALPALFVAFGAFAIAGSGLPGSAAFVGELMLFFAAWGTAPGLGRIAAVVCIFGVVLSATYSFRAFHRTFFGPGVAGKIDKSQDLRALPLCAALVLFLGTVSIGVWPRLVTDAFGARTKAVAQTTAPTIDPSKQAAR
jgi:NADH-quinone oxidoreductase subunit M